MAPAEADPPLRKTAARGFAWTIAQNLFIRGLSLVGFVVLARVLSPHDYGLAALANVFVFLMMMLTAGGLSQTLVQRANVDRTDLDTAFWIALGIGVALAAVLSLAAWPLAAAFDEPELRPVLQVLSITFVCIGGSGAHQAVLTRDLAFHTLAVVTMVANVVATVVGIAVALLGGGVWALVVQTLLGSAMTAGGVVLTSGYRPGLDVSWARFRELFATSRHFLGTSLLGFLNMRTDDFLIGSVLGSAALGVYAVAYRLQVVLSDVLTAGARVVAFPVFSRVQGDRERLGRAYASATRMCAVIAMPGFIWVAAAAPDVIRVVFGEKWMDAVPVMRILALYGPLTAILQFNGSLLQSVGRARLVFNLTLLSTVLQVIGFAIAVSYGIVWVAASYVIRGYLLAPIGLVVATREVGSSLREHLGPLLAPTVSAAAMAGAVLGAMALMGDAVPATARLAVELVVGAVTYLGVLYAVGGDILAEAAGYIRAALPGRLVARRA